MLRIACIALTVLTLLTIQGCHSNDPQGAYEDNRPPLMDTSGFNEFKPIGE